MIYTSCIHLEHGITFFSNSVQICCISSHPGGGHILQVENYHGEPIDWEEIFKNRSIKKPSTTILTYPAKNMYINFRIINFSLID